MDIKCTYGLPGFLPTVIANTRLLLTSYQSEHSRITNLRTVCILSSVRYATAPLVHMLSAQSRTRLPTVRMLTALSRTRLPTVRKLSALSRTRLPTVRMLSALSRTRLPTVRKLSAPSLPTLASHLRCGLMTSLPPGSWCPGVATSGFRYESLLYS